MEKTNKPNFYSKDETQDSPNILLDEERLIFKISGPSFYADAFVTYAPVIEWLDNLNNKLSSKLKSEFHFTILSSASHKMVYEIMLKLEYLCNYGNTVEIVWYYADTDEDMLEIGESFSETINLPFKFIAKKGRKNSR